MGFFPFVIIVKRVLPASTMSRCQHPLFRYQHSSAVEYLVRTAEDRGQKRPVTRQWRPTAHYPRLTIYGLRPSPHSTLCTPNTNRHIVSVIFFDFANRSSEVRLGNFSVIAIISKQHEYGILQYTLTTPKHTYIDTE